MRTMTWFTAALVAVFLSLPLAVTAQTITAEAIAEAMGFGAEDRAKLEAGEIVSTEIKAKASRLGYRSIGVVAPVQMGEHSVQGHRLIDPRIFHPQGDKGQDPQSRGLKECRVDQDLLEPLTSGLLRAAVVDVVCNRARRISVAVVVRVTGGKRHRLDQLPRRCLPDQPSGERGRIALAHSGPDCRLHGVEVAEQLPAKLQSKSASGVAFGWDMQ